jgi:hypothetical protein
MAKTKVIGELKSNPRNNRFEKLYGRVKVSSVDTHKLALQDPVEYIKAKDL